MIRRLQATPETWVFLGLGALAVGALGVAASPVPEQALAVALALSVALLGLPHGALDPWVARQAGLWRSGWGLAAFHLAYVALAALVVVAWWLAPGISLALFLAISAWHFAGDWRQDLPAWARATTGLCLLALPAWRWPAEVGGIFAVLSGTSGAAIADGLAGMAPWLLVGALAAVPRVVARSPATVLELAAVFALALLLPPLVFFIVYFCALHSLRHLRIAAIAADPSSRRRMAGVAATYTLLTLAAAAVAWPWLSAAAIPAAAPGADLLRLVFIGLAALTLPHMLVVMRSEKIAGARP